MNRLRCLAFALFGMAAYGPASSATVSLTGTTGSNAMNWTGQFLGSSTGNTQTAPPNGNYGNDYLLAVPGTYTYTDTFGKQTYPLVNGSGVPFESSGTPVGTYSFQDTYQFQLGSAASGDSLVVSLNLGQGFGSQYNISNLQFRLYGVPSSAGATPALAPPTGTSGFQWVTTWTGVSGPDNGTAIVGNFTNLAPNTSYFLDVAGTASGSSGGTYVGQLQLSPVPVPAALPLLVSGLLSLGALSRQLQS